jgi:hypothetical protein
MVGKREWGAERGNDDGDEGHGANVRKVVPENRYLDKLRERLAHQPHQPAAGPKEPKNPGFTVYGDDGRPLKK